MLSTLIPNHGPTTGATVLTLSGSGFGATPAVTVGASQCVVQTASDTSIECRAPAGSGTGLPVAVDNAGSLSNTLPFGYDAPAITAVTPSTGPTSGGVIITIDGANFGPAGATVTVGANACGAATTTHTRVTCTLPAGTGTKAVQVTTGGQTSNSSSFTYAAPAVSAVTPSTGPTTGGTLLTISGSNFGASGAAISVGGATCSLTQQTQTQLICASPPGAGATNAVLVTVDGQSSNTSNFAYAAPALSSLSPAGGPTSGNVPLTINGSNFGAAGATVTVGAQACPPTQQSHTQVICTLPPGSGTGNAVRVTVAGQASGTLPFSYNAPALSSLSPTTGPASGGIPLTIDGANFGAAGASVTLGGAACPVTQQSHTQLRCTLPAGTGANKSVIVTSGGQSSNALTFTYASSAPVATNGSKTTAEDTATTVTLTATDPDGDPLTYFVVAQPAAGTGQVTLNGAVATYTPASNYHGSTSFTFKANDGALDSNTGTIALTVTPVNDAPIATAKSATTPSGTKVDVTLAGVDVDGDALTFAISTPPSAAQGTATLAGAVASFTPASGFSGAASFSFTASDGTLTSAPAQVTIQVGVGQRPPVAMAQTVQAQEDVVKTFMLGATDPDGDALTFEITQQPPVGQGTVSLAGKVATYTPPLNWNGTTQLQFTASDGALVSPPAQVTITVAPVNDPPSAEGAVATTQMDQPVTLTLHASDPENDPVTFTLAIPPRSREGTVSITGDSATFTPGAGFTGTSAFTFEASDGTATARATATITVEPGSGGQGCSCAGASGGPLLLGLCLLALALRRHRPRM